MNQGEADRQNEARLEAIVRSAMDAIITIDRDQRIVVFNAAAEQMFGCPAAEAIGTLLDRFIPARFRAIHRSHIERFIRTGETARRMGQQTALSALRADGTEFPIEASISQALVGEQLLLTVILRDISERMHTAGIIKRAHDELREGEARLEAIVQSAMDAIITVDSNQRIVLFNQAAEQVFGVSAAHVLGETLDRLLPLRFREAHQAHVTRFARTGATSRRMGVQTALWGLRSDGSEFPVEASISQAVVGGHTLMTVILRDITERTRAEAQLRGAHEELRRLSNAMLEVREAERTRIARELHDELGQALTALKMDVDLMDTMIPAAAAGSESTASLSGETAAAMTERTAAMRELLDFTVATTRRISADLRPLVLDDLGLGPAAEWLVQNVVQRAGLECDLRVDAECASIGEPYASALFRVMQESLTNVVRHARAKRVTVQLRRNGDAALLAVADDGVGLDRNAPPKPRSFGLRGIGERVLALGGEVNVVGEPGAGTTLTVRIPLVERGDTDAATDRESAA
jgi:hypothetical protein